VTLHVLRRYVQPLELTGAHLPLLDLSQTASLFSAAAGSGTTRPPGRGSASASAAAAVAAATGGPVNGSVVLEIPDLTLCTREIAWQEVAQEFQVLAPPTGEDAHGHSIFLGSTVNLQQDTDKTSAPTAAAASGSAGHSSSKAAGHSVSKTEGKKRKYLQNNGYTTGAGAAAAATDTGNESPRNRSKSNRGGEEQQPSSSSSSDNAQLLEVLAPQFREVVPVTVLAQQVRQTAVKCLHWLL
jgi:hypothetical protein